MPGSPSQLILPVIPIFATVHRNMFHAAAASPQGNAAVDPPAGTISLKNRRNWFR